MKPGIYATLRDEPVLCIKLSAEERLKIYHAFWIKKSNGDSFEVGVETHGVVRADLVAQNLFEEVQPEPDDSGEKLVKLDNRQLVVLSSVLFNSGFDNLYYKFSKAMRPVEKVPTLSTKGPKWDEARRTVLEEYDYECVNCGMTEKEHIDEQDRSIHVHHIIPFKRFNTTGGANNPDNLIPLCSTCHKALESEPPETVSQIS